MLAVIGLVLGACSGGDDPSASADSTAGDDTTVADTTDSGVPDTSVVPTSTSVAADSDTDTDTTVADVTTTTEPPPIVVPMGVRWQTVETVPAAAQEASATSIIDVDGELWMFARRFNSTVVLRSGDAALTWETVPVVEPPSSGSQSVSSVVPGPDGRLVAWGTTGSNCQVNIDAGGGYRETGLCTRFRPVLYISDDDGASWGQVDPPAMAPSGNTSVTLIGLVATPTGYLAAGTVKGEDWHVRLWSSPDGETWTLDREIRGDGAPISARQLLGNGDEVVLIADEHPCAEVNYNTPGWYLGPQWVEHMRIFSGTGAGDLALLGSADHPFARDVEPIECPDGFDQERIAQLNAMHPQASGAVIGGVVTMLEEVDEVEEAEDVDLSTSGSRQITELIDGGWIPTLIEGVQSPNEASGSTLIDVDGRPGIMEFRSTGQVTKELVPILPEADGSWVQHVPEQAVIASRVYVGAWSGGALVVAGSLYDEPYATTITPDNRLAMHVWRSIESTGPATQLCRLEPGGSCQFADLSQVEGYPDFAGIDLSGADLSFTDFGDADLTGADFTGATLWEVTLGEGAVVQGADFNGAQLPRSQFGDARGATFDGASLRWAELVDATGSSFVGADLEFASLSFSSLPDLSGALLGYSDLEVVPPADGRPFEIALDGIDLTNADVSAPRDAPRLAITSVVGTVLTDALFKNVDLTGLDPAVVDLTDVDVWDDSICPDGLPPDDPPIGTCVRGAAP